MLSFLLWNIYKKPLSSRVCRLAKAHALDVVILLESTLRPSALVQQLNASTGANDYAFCASAKGKIQVYARQRVGPIAEQFIDETGNISIRRLDLTGAASILLAIVHGPPKGPWESTDQAIHAVVLAGDVRQAEKDVGHDRTLLVGDLNMNPYEPGVTGAHAFNAVMTKRSAAAGMRTVQGRSFPSFYNPMWGQFGDRTPGPPGTFYHRSASPTSHLWNVYDQVLIRPSIMDKPERVEVLISDGVEPLVTKGGLPRRQTASDHLPVLFQLRI